VLKAQERRIRPQKLKGELVDRARAETLMFRLAREERDGWPFCELDRSSNVRNLTRSFKAWAATILHRGRDQQRQRLSFLE
jgi:hypothetical protein